MKLAMLTDTSSPSRGTWVEIGYKVYPDTYNGVVPLAGDVG